LSFGEAAATVADSPTHPKDATMLRRLLALCLLPAALAPLARADDPRPAAGPLNAWQLRRLVAQAPTGADAVPLLGHFEATFGKDALAAGKAKAKVTDTLACFAISQPAAGPGKQQVVLSVDGQARTIDLQPVVPVIYAAFVDLPAVCEVKYAYQVDGKPFGVEQNFRVEYFPRHPDSVLGEGVKAGTVTKYSWKNSKVFPGTERDYWVYVPAAYDPKGPPACLMVFQDGQGYLGGPYYTPTVLDNLIARKELPVIVGVFINPGVIPQEGRPPRSNRSVEYDTLSDAYARFLRDEVLPEVGKTVRLTKDPAGRGICGISSGGICAWTAAWEQPDQFRKVLSHVGSFTNIRGGHVYPALIRKEPARPIRVWLQDGARDLDNPFGNWPLANQEMASALKFKGYDYHFDYGPGFHSGNHGGSRMADSLKWLWRDHKVSAE
jgi:enterochelin esterase family protein